ncbi:50S ribosomal protein L29 [Buchnera aphidicola (Pseudoregma panicola)]|uniref:50S ribosomal protein L29 n=1 Tax=Buchnera aphidicola TaxID=9 RepID=UPI0031B71E2E
MVINKYDNIINDLNDKLFLFLKEEFNLKIQLFSGKLKKTHLLKFCRKKISKLKFLIRLNEVKNKNNE